MMMNCIGAGRPYVMGTIDSPASPNIWFRYCECYLPPGSVAPKFVITQPPSYLYTLIFIPTIHSHSIGYPLHQTLMQQVVYNDHSIAAELINHFPFKHPHGVDENRLVSAYQFPIILALEHPLILMSIMVLTLSKLYPSS